MVKLLGHVGGFDPMGVGSYYPRVHWYLFVAQKAKTQPLQVISSNGPIVLPLCPPRCFKDCNINAKVGFIKSTLYEEHKSTVMAVQGMYAFKYFTMEWFHCSMALEGEK